MSTTRPAIAPPTFEYDEAGYRAAYLHGLSNLFDAVDARRLLFVSSTAVYGQNEGEWVDESSDTDPPRFNGRVLLGAEALAGRSAAQSTVVRFSGIYGPGRDYLVRKAASGEASCREDPPQWTNRIHADDCAGVLAHLLTLDRPAPVYCASDSYPAPRASDSYPAPRCEVMDWLAGQLDVAPPRRESSDRGQGKRVVNARLLASGYRLIHPDYRSGYQEMLQ